MTLTPTARRVARLFPVGTKVRAIGGTPLTFSLVEGVVARFIPGVNAQGGVVVVAWENGAYGRHSAGSLVRSDEIVDGKLPRRLTGRD